MDQMVGAGSEAGLGAQSLIDRALQRGGIEPVFQPVVRLADGDVVGYEALSRFPTLGLAPDVCFGIAATVGRRVELETAAVNAIASAGPPPAGALLFVNLSPTALSTSDVLTLRSRLPDRLVVEMTEEDAVDDYDRLRRHVASWTAQGARIAIDDTGSGYASMQHAIQLLPDFLKLDCTLIEDVDTDRTRQALVRSLVTFAREVGATVVAEGVERHAQLRWLREADVALAQGFLFARPAPDWPRPWAARPADRRHGEGEATLIRRLGNARDARQAAGAVVDQLFRRGDVMPSVYLEEDGRLRCYAQRGLWQILDGMSPNAGVTGLAYRTGERQVVTDITKSPDYLQAVPGVVAELCVPIVMDHSVVGALNVDCTSRPPDDLVDELEMMAAQLGARLAALGPRARRLPLRTLVPALTPIARSTSRSGALEALVNASIDACGFDSAMVAMVVDGAFEVALAHGPLAAALGLTRQEELAQLAGLLGLLSSCHASGESAGRCFLGTEALRRAGARAMAAVPLNVGGDRQGMVIVANTEPRPLAPDDIEALELIGVVGGACLAAASEFDALRVRAASDPLTGAGSHGAFYECIESVDSAPRALIVLDLDQFKAFNDAHGHPHGDDLLRVMAAAIESVTRRQDAVFRIGGDEFAVVAYGLEGPDLEGPVKRVQRAVADALRPFKARSSLGASVIPAGRSGVDAFVEADAALYAAKRASAATRATTARLLAGPAGADVSQRPGGEHLEDGLDDVAGGAAPLDLVDTVGQEPVVL
jgi:diguanylate cyclase (GGDEF)-like protein